MHIKCFYICVFVGCLSNDLLSAVFPVSLDLVILRLISIELKSILIPHQKKERKVDSHSKSQVDLTIDLPEMIVSDASNQTGSCFCGVVGLFKAGWCCLIIRLMWMTPAQTVTEVSLVTWSAALCSYSKLIENSSNSCQLWAFQTVQQCIRNVLKTKCHREIDTVFYIARYVRFVYIGLVCLAVCISSLQACIIRNVVHICSQTV